MKYSLIIPIYNEIRTLPSLVNKLIKLEKSIEIIIVDDGSDDGTEEFLNKLKQFSIIRNCVNLGKGAAVKKGVQAATNQNIILMDGDLEIDIDEIPFLISQYDNDSIDVLVGKRWENYKNSDKDLNLIGNFFINFIFNIFFNSNFSDVLCCVKVLKKYKFESLDIFSDNFAIEVETMAKLVMQNAKIKEIKVKYQRRTIREGKKLKLTDSWNIIITIIKIRFFNLKIF